MKKMPRPLGKLNRANHTTATADRFRAPLERSDRPDRLNHASRRPKRTPLPPRSPRNVAAALLLSRRRPRSAPHSLADCSALLCLERSLPPAPCNAPVPTICALNGAPLTAAKQYSCSLPRPQTAHR
ncbi:MAG: hypothetical protein FWD58_07310 [Firmicutes bacterium]|nr:hypothetical protein [Bacillota bacterium]